jgi:putative SOS response-associated peptidase YedK
MDVCGRYASTRGPTDLAAEFDALDATGPDSPGADYNVAPTKEVISVVQRHPGGDPDVTERSLRLMRWGLVPKWAKDPAQAARMINARSETVTTKPAFRTSVRYQRCLLPADGWYEWKRDGERKTPFFVTPQDGSGLAFAAIWAVWRDPRAPEPPLVTCSIVTTDAVGPLAEVHPRMPLALERDAWAHWLDPDIDDVAGLLRAPSREQVARLEIRPVSSAVNSVRNNGPELTEAEVPALLERVGLDSESVESR